MKIHYDEYSVEAILKVKHRCANCGKWKPIDKMKKCMDYR